MSSSPETLIAPLHGGAAAHLPHERFTVLLVEDDAAMRRFLEVTLRRAGFRVVTATDGEAGINLALTEGVDAIVTDAMLPRIGGREMCRFLRRHPASSHIPTLLLTGLVLGADETFEGIDVRMSKPVETKNLITSLKNLIDTRSPIAA